MEAEKKEKWVTALRSGQYRQGRRALITVENGEVGYCCLGVLCDLAIKDGVKGVRIENAQVEVFYRDENDEPVEDDWVEHSDGDLPLAVQEWAGLDDNDPQVEVGVLSNIPISQVNDGSDDYRVEPHSFKQIADIIEQQL